jgi:hypothetical protein
MSKTLTEIAQQLRDTNKKVHLKKESTAEQMTLFESKGNIR